MGVGYQLKSILRDKKMTIKQLSELSKIPLNTLYSITKRDSEHIDPVTLRRIAEVLEVNPADIDESLVINLGCDYLHQTDGGEFIAVDADSAEGRVLAAFDSLKNAEHREFVAKVMETVVQGLNSESGRNNGRSETPPPQRAE